MLDFFYPPYCQICHSPLDDARQLVCLKCWMSFESYGEFHIRFPAHIREIDSVVVALLGEGGLDDPLSQIIHHFKYDRRAAHAAGLASRMAAQLISYPWIKRIDLIIPVPLHPSRRRSRGYNQSLLLAEQLGNMFGIQVVSEVVVRIRDTQSQTKLNQEQRQKNVAGAFQVRDPERLTGKSVLVVDDVITTGATINECLKILKKGGVREVHAVAGVHFQHPLP